MASAGVNDFDKIFAAAKKKPHNFALLISKGGVVLEADPRKSPDFLRKKAKKSGGGRGASGIMKVAGKSVLLTPETDDFPNNLPDVATKYFRSEGYNYRFEIASASPQAEPVVSDEADAVQEEDEPDLDSTDYSALLAALRKRAHNFAWLVSGEGLILKAHIRKPVNTLIKQARSEGASAKGAWGLLSREGKTLVLTCENEPPRSLTRKARLALKEQGLNVKIVLRYPGGEFASDDAEDTPLDTSDPTASSEPEASPQDKKLASLRDLYTTAQSNGDSAKSDKILMMMERLSPGSSAALGDAAPLGGDPQTQEGATPTLVDTPTPPGAFSGRNFGAFRVSIKASDLPMSGSQLTVEAYRQYLTMKAKAPASVSDAEAFISEHRIPVIMMTGTTTPYDINPETDFIPGSKQIAEQGFVWLNIIPLDFGPETAESKAEIEAQIDDLSEEDKQRLHALTDEGFYSSTQCAPGTKLTSSNDPLAETWRQQNRDAFKRLSEYNAFPDHIKKLFPLAAGDGSGVPLNIQNLERIRQIAHDLNTHFTPAEIAALAARADSPLSKGNHVWTTKDLAAAGAMVADIIREDFEETNTGGGTVLWIKGKFSGKRIAQLEKSEYGVISSTEITAGERTNRALLDREAAITFARKAALPSAVFEEDGGYVVYKLNSPPTSEQLKIKNISAPTWMPDPSQSAVTGIVKNCAAMLSSEGKILENSGGKSIIRGGGAGLDPYEGPLSAYGPGLQILRSEAEFKEQYGHVLEDIALDAVDKAADAASALRQQFATPKTELDTDEQAALEKAVAALNAADKEGFDARVAFDVARAHELELKKKYLPATPEQRLEIEAAEEKSKKAREHSDDLGKRKTERYAKAAEGFPLALNLGGWEDRAKFMKSEPHEKIAAFRVQVDRSQSRVDMAREKIQNGNFDPWAHKNLTEAAADKLGLTGKQRHWAEEQAKETRGDKEFWDITQTVVSIGVSVGATLTTGPLGTGLAASALALDSADFIKTVDDYHNENAISNMSLDPYAMKIIEPGDPPGKVEVMFSIISMGFSAHDAAKLVDTLMEGGTKISVATVAEMAEADILKAFDSIGLKASSDMKVRTELLARWQRAFGSKRVKDIVTDGMDPHTFEATFQSADRNAATLVKTNDDGTYTVHVVVRDDLPHDEALEVLEEELRHAEQVASGEWKNELALLNENALGSWPTKSPLDRLPTIRAQLDMETDVANKLQAELLEKLETAAEVDKEAIARRLENVESQIADYQQKRAAIPEGLSGDEVPDWVTDAPPPRLFSTTDGSITAKNNLAGESLYSIKLVPEQKLFRLPPKDHEFYKRNGKLELRRVKGAAKKGIPKMVLQEQEDGLLKLVEDTSSRLSPEERLIELEKRFSKIPLPPKSALGIAAREHGLGPKELAYVRSFEDAVTDLRAFGVELDDILGDLGDLEGTKFASQFRKRIRTKMIETIEKKAAVDPDEAQELMEAFLTSFPDQKSTGTMFEAFRDANLPDYMKTVPRSKNATKLADIERRGDDVSSIIEIVKGGKGPRIKGRYLQEDKSSLTALDMDQAVDYDKALTAGKKRNGKPSILAGPENAQQELKGVIYCFPNQAAASEAENLLLGNSAIINKGFFNISYYEDGRLNWM